MKTGAGVVMIAVAVLVAIGVFATAASYSRALGAPGHGSPGTKTTVWLREHHLGSAVTVGESWLDSRRLPPRQHHPATPTPTPTTETP